MSSGSASTPTAGIDRPGRDLLRRRRRRGAYPRHAGRAPARHATRCISRRIHREMLNLPMAQSIDRRGVPRRLGGRHRALGPVRQGLRPAGAPDAGRPLPRPSSAIYNTCAGYSYVRSTNIKPVSNWNLGEADGPYEDLDGFMTRADAVAESLLESGITAMKIWPFDPAAIENDGLFITPTQMKAALEPFEKIRKAVGDKMEIMVEFHSLWNLPTAKKIARALEPYNPTWYEDPIRMNSPQALAEYARSTDVWVCASETLGIALSLQGHARPRRHARRDGRSVLDRRADRGAQDRRDGRDLPPPLRAARLHRPGRLHRRRSTPRSASRTR